MLTIQRFGRSSWAALSHIRLTKANKQLLSWQQEKASIYDIERLIVTAAWRSTVEFTYSNNEHVFWCSRSRGVFVGQCHSRLCVRICQEEEGGMIAYNCYARGKMGGKLEIEAL